MKVKSEWVNFENQVVESDVNFLRQPSILHTMFQSDGPLFTREYNYLKENHNHYLQKFNNPTEYGSPFLFSFGDEKYNPNDIHHLYHLCRYEDAIGKIETPLNILEWGGGYGNMCKVIRIVYGELIESYTIVDLPKFTKLAERYVTNTCDDWDGHHHYSVEDFELSSEYNMFISTWALSESPSTWTDYLTSNSFFGVDRFLISLHQCGDHIPFMEESTKLRNELKSFETKEELVDVIDGINYYIFK